MIKQIDARVLLKCKNTMLMDYRNPADTKMILMLSIGLFFVSVLVSILKHFNSM